MLKKKTPIAGKLDILSSLTAFTVVFGKTHSNLFYLFVCLCSDEASPFPAKEKKPIRTHT